MKNPKAKLISKAKRFPECHLIIMVKVKPTKNNWTMERRVHKKTLNKMQKNMLYMLLEAVQERFSSGAFKDVYFDLKKS